MKWHSLLKDPNDLPQRINKFEESEDVLVIERIFDIDTMSFHYVRSEYIFYYGHWEPNGEEGWRVRSTNYSDCGKFGGFPIDTRYREQQERSIIEEWNLSEFSKKEQDLITKNCPFDSELGGYITCEVVGWSYFPNEEEFVEENKEFTNQNS